MNILLVKIDQRLTLLHETEATLNFSISFVAKDTLFNSGTFTQKISLTNLNAKIINNTIVNKAREVIKNKYPTVKIDKIILSGFSQDIEIETDKKK